MTDAAHGAVQIADKTLRYGDLRRLLLRRVQTDQIKSIKILANGEISLKGLTELDVYGGFKTKSDDGTKYTLTGDDGRKASEFTADDWEKNFIESRRAEDVANPTILASAKLMRRMFLLAVENKKISPTAVPHISAPKIPKEVRSREECLYKEDFDRLPAYIDAKFHPLVTFLFYQGTRINETLDIRWHQILPLSAATYRPDARKNKTSDAAPKVLQKETIEALKKLKQGGDNDCVFEAIRSRGKHPVKMFEGAFRNAMLKLKPINPKNGHAAGPTWKCAQCGAIDDSSPAPKPEDMFARVCPNPYNRHSGQQIPMQWKYIGPSPHSLRASCAVFYVESGVPEVQIMKDITGHADFKTFRGYARTNPGNTRAQMDKANENRNRLMEQSGYQTVHTAA